MCDFVKMCDLPAFYIVQTLLITLIEAHTLHFDISQNKVQPDTVRLQYAKTDSVSVESEEWKQLRKFRITTRPGQKIQLSSQRLMFGNPEDTLTNLAPLVQGFKKRREIAVLYPFLFLGNRDFAVAFSVPPFSGIPPGIMGHALFFSPNFSGFPVFSSSPHFFCFPISSFFIPHFRRFPHFCPDSPIFSFSPPLSGFPPFSFSPPLFVFS